MPRRALVIGRFQPPHNGHLATLRRAAEVADRTLVVVGSAQRSHVVDDPLTAGERIQLLTGLADEEDLPIDHIIPVPDLGQFHLWVEHVRAWTPPFDVVVTGSPMTAYLFEQAGVAVQRVDPVDRKRLSGTAIRQKIARGESVAPQVPRCVADFLAGDDVRARFAAMRRHHEGEG